MIKNLRLGTGIIFSAFIFSPLATNVQDEHRHHLSMAGEVAEKDFARIKDFLTAELKP